jgi:uncharacterized protein
MGKQTLHEKEGGSCGTCLAGKRLGGYRSVVAILEVGASWEGFVIQQIIRRLGAARDECFFWATHGGAELDLLVVRGRHRLGFEVKRTSSPRVAPSMKSAMADLKLHRLDVIHAGEETFPLGTDMRAVSLKCILRDLAPLS